MLRLLPSLHVHSRSLSPFPTALEFPTRSHFTASCYLPPLAARYKVKVNVTAKDDGTVFTCQADNNFGTTTHDAITLSVLCE